MSLLYPRYIVMQLQYHITCVSAMLCEEVIVLLFQSVSVGLSVHRKTEKLFGNCCHRICVIELIVFPESDYILVTYDLDSCFRIST